MKQLKMKQKTKKHGFIGMSLGAFGLSLLRSMLVGEGVIKNDKGKDF